MRGRAMSLIVCSWSILLVAAALVPWQDTTAAQPGPAPTSVPPPPPPQSCPVTLPTSDPPPGFPESSEPSYHGNGELWTLLWPNGRVVFAPDGPGFVLADGSLGMKWPWIPAVRGELTVDGRRLDGHAPPLWADIGEGFTDQGRFFPTYLIFPTPGCWEVTGRVGASSLTFVTLVVKIGEGPRWRPAADP